jgi:arylformamidase
LSDWIDISVALEDGRTYWPDDPPFRRRWLCEGEVNVSALEMSAHAGTHMDAPLHYFAGGVTLDELPLGATIGTAIVSERVAPAERALLKVGGRELTLSEARQLTDCRCVGIDGPSVGDAEVHRTLLAAGVWIIEWLDLSKVEPGEYDLVCLPLKIAGAEGAPARAALRRRD